MAIRHRPDASSHDAERLTVTYALACSSGTEAFALAREIALEQTVELPEECISERIEQAVVGRIDGVSAIDDSTWRATVSYPASVVAGGAGQLLNVLFGNISLMQGIRIIDVRFPPILLRAYPGPQHGIEGLRGLCGVEDRRPLLCTALKPVGLSSEEIADLCYRFALGGIDIIKDDHGLAEQATAPFRERVLSCQKAIEQANRKTGRHSAYFPHLVATGSMFEDDAKFARSVGCRGVLVSPFLIGLDAVRWLAENLSLAIFAHPALTGALFHRDHGIAPAVILGHIFRLVGSDGVIYPNVEGRFPFTSARCKNISNALREPLGDLRAAVPVPAGGINVDRIPYWLEQYGPDTVFLVGRGLYAQGDVVDASKRLLEAVTSKSVAVS